MVTGRKGAKSPLAGNQAAPHTMYDIKLEVSGESVGNYVKVTNAETHRLVAKVPWGESDHIAAELVKRWNIHNDLADIARAYRDLLRTTAQTGVDARTYAYINKFIAEHELEA
jgi:hypothetical protein